VQPSWQEHRHAAGEKTRETKERVERDARNREHAGSSYQVPTPLDFSAEEEHSGLPWGSLNMRHVLTRGHETESRRSSGRDEYIHEDSAGRRHDPYGQGQGTGGHDLGAYGQPTSYGGSVAGDEFGHFYEEEPSPHGDAYEYDQHGADSGHYGHR
jgi:hypothetical protein